MRVTNSMLVSKFMNNLNISMSKMAKLQNQMASGKKYGHISDNPISVVYSREARYKLARLSHYQSAVDSSQEWLKQVETGLMEISSILSSAQEACIDAATDVKGESDKRNVSDYIAQLRDHILTTLNTTFGDKFVFGGYNTTGANYTSSYDGAFTVSVIPGNASANPPIKETNVLYYNDERVTPHDVNNPNDTGYVKTAMLDKLKKDVLSFNVGPGVDMDVTMNGLDVVMFATAGGGNDNLYNLLDDLYKSVRDDEDTTIISGYLDKLQAAHNDILGKIAEVGGRTNRLDLITARYEQDEVNYSQMMSDAEDADMAEVLMNQKMVEAVYNAALAAGSKIIQTSLMDFLR